MSFRYLVITISLASLGLAADPVAKVSSSKDFQLRGTTVHTTAVPSWPVMAGDKIATMGSPAVISLSDGSQLTLAPSSTAQVDSENGSLAVRLIAGGMQYQLSAGSSTRVFNNQTPQAAASGVISNGPVVPANAVHANALPTISRRF